MTTDVTPFTGELAGRYGTPGTVLDPARPLGLHLSKDGSRGSGKAELSSPSADRSLSFPPLHSLTAWFPLQPGAGTWHLKQAAVSGYGRFQSRPMDFPLAVYLKLSSLKLPARERLVRCPEGWSEILPPSSLCWLLSRTVPGVSCSWFCFQYAASFRGGGGNSRCTKDGLGMSKGQG